MGAKANPVVVITAADLESNGGQYKLVSKYAMKVSGNDALAAMGGTPMVVYPVSQAQIDSGEFELVQGHPADVAQVTGRGQESSAWAMPVYHEGPRTWPGGGVVDNDYLDVVNSLSAAVIAYWPLDETSGTVIADATGNNRGGTITGSLTLGAAGQLGAAFSFPGTETDFIYAGANLRGAIDPREYAVSMIVNVNHNLSANPRLHVIYTDTFNNYSVPEVRTGSRLDMYLQEDGQTYSKAEFGILPDEEWVHLVFFNSESGGQFGVYLNGLYLPYGRGPLPGLPVGEDTITAGYPDLGRYLIGLLQHVVWLDVGIPSQADVDALYYGAFPQPSTDIANIWSDTFDGNEAAPIATPRASGLVVTDTGNLLSVSSDKLIWTGKTTNVVDPRVISTAAHGRKQGRAAFGVVTPGSLAAGWGAVDTATPNAEAILFQSSTLFSYSNTNLLSLAPSGAVEYETAHVMRIYGAYHFVKGGAFTEWTLVYVSNVLRADLYAGAGVGTVSTTNAVNALHVKDLPAPFDKDFDIATTRLAGGRAAGNTFTHTADCILEFTITAIHSAGNIDFRFRVQDANNYWQVIVTSAGAITLNEVVAGTPTQRATHASGASTAWRIQIICAGSTITCIPTTAALTAAVRWSYASATNFATETDGELAGLGTGGLISDIVAWPRTLSGAAVTVLDEAVS